MTIHLATDHAGFAHKEALKQYLISEGIDVVDHGADVFNDADDYPDFVVPAALAVSLDPESMGVIFGGSGQGEGMAVNRINGVRAVVYYGGDTSVVVLSREHNASNVLSIGARFVSIEEMLAVVKMWLETPFSNDERHVRRLNKF